MRVALDVEGGDYAPDVTLAGAKLALAADSNLQLILTGFAEHVEPLAAQHPERVQARATTEVIAMGEHPAEAARSKKDSSIVVGCKLVGDGSAAGFFSAGSTGACMAAALLYIGRIKGISRPIIASVLPSAKGSIVLADVGANADVKPKYLPQFAQMTAAYARAVLGIANPRVGLLNIGEEATKGSQLAQEAYALLKQGCPEFVGNVEGSEIFSGDFDCIITDGFTGNVVLKTIEGASGMLFGELKTVLSANLLRKLAAALVMPGLRNLKKKLSADEVGGAPLLGVQGSCLIGHGSSNAQAIANGILATSRTAQADLPGLIARAIAT